MWVNYKGYTFSADIFSLGCIMAFQCNKGKHLFSMARTIPELVQKMQREVFLREPSAVTQVSWLVSLGG